MDVANIRETTDDKLAGIGRLLLALLFVTTGAWSKDLKVTAAEGKP